LKKNLDFTLKSQIKLLSVYVLSHVYRYFEQDLFNKYTKLWYENNLDDTTKSDDEINNEALRLLNMKF
jgi:hypothetical protein